VSTSYDQPAALGLRKAARAQLLTGHSQSQFLSFSVPHPQAWEVTATATATDRAATRAGRVARAPTRGENNSRRLTSVQRQPRGDAAAGHPPHRAGTGAGDDRGLCRLVTTATGNRPHQHHRGRHLRERRTSPSPMYLLRATQRPQDSTTRPHPPCNSNNRRSCTHSPTSTLPSHHLLPTHHPPTLPRTPTCWPHTPLTVVTLERCTR
jgi:hypothetical protein